MLLLLKKNGQKSDGDQSLAWHPNFRIAEQLPDTKTVRTKFFVNVVAIAAALSLSLLVSLREFKIHSLKAQHAALELQIEEVTKASANAIATYKLFQAEEKLFNEAQDYVKDPFRFTDFMIRLGEVLPSDIKINRVDYKGTAGGVGVSASANGLDADASDLVSAFVQKVQSDVVLARDYPVVKLTGLARNVADGQLKFELSFSPRPVVKAPEKSKAKKSTAK